jgi:hypothetical protein
MDSQRRGDRDQFYDAYLTEIAAFDEKGVIPDFVTSDELVAASITAKPLPMAALFTISYVENGDGSWTLKKYKARLVILGHPGNVVAGVHWEGTKYAATLTIDAARIFVAICVYMGWDEKFFDACTAFLNGKCKTMEKVGVRFPPELRKYRRVIDAMGNVKFVELLGILHKAAYGHPIASARWSEARDTFTLDYFNRDGWSCISISATVRRSTTWRTSSPSRSRDWRANACRTPRRATLRLHPFRHGSSSSLELVDQSSST